MEILTARTDTYLKKAPVQSSRLPKTEKIFEVSGASIEIDRADSAADGHLKVTVSGGGGVWYIYESHWSAVTGVGQGVGNGDVPTQAVRIVASFEGFVDHVYDDGVHVPTIGYGTTRYPNGRPVRFGDPSVTESTASTYLANDLEATKHEMASSIPFWSDMDDNRRSALISFAYNLGDFFFDSPGFRNISRALSDRRWDDIPQVMPLYSNPNNPNVHPGLLRRRLAEAQLWNGEGPFALSTDMITGNFAAERQRENGNVADVQPSHAIV